MNTAMKTLPLGAPLGAPASLPAVLHYSSVPEGRQGCRRSQCTEGRQGCRRSQCTEGRQGCRRSQCTEGRQGCRRSQLGFTLLEVLIALTILAVGILAVMRLFPMSLVQQRRAAERTVVASLARTQLSEVRTGGMGQSLATWLQGNAYRVVAEAARSYTLYDSWRTTATRMGASDVDLYRVVFTVRLHDGREEEFVTYVTER